MKHLYIILFFITCNVLNAQDTISTQNNKFTLYFIGHGTLYINYDGCIIHIDPWSNLADYSALPDADYILITHDHHDHLDFSAISNIIKDETTVIAPEICSSTLKNINQAIYLSNGNKYHASWGELNVVPAYNIQHLRESGKPFHPKGQGNGYVLTIDGTSIYIAGDTEIIPEMNDLKNIDIAFLPMNLPYTMTPEMVAKTAKLIKPKILYPYHFGETDTNELVNLLKDTNIEVRIRKMK